MTTFWCELAWLGGSALTPAVMIECSGGSITLIATGAEPTPQMTVLPGLTLPGLANAHSHAFQRALRGRTQAPSGGSFWTWREQMYAAAQMLDPARSEALARATFGEMALAGITLVGEFDYIHHSEALIRAADAAGVRLTLIDACYLQGGLPRFHDAGAAAWRERVSALRTGPAVRLAAAIHSVRAVDPDSAAEVAAHAAERGWPLHAHVSEQPAENEECRRRYGCTPVQLLDAAGALSDRFTAVHATHLTTGDAERLAEVGAYTCLCPTTERDLADGIGRVHCELTLGSDSQAMIDLFEEMRAVELDERLATGVRGNHAGLDLALAATASGYASLGWPEGGRIATGALADFVSVSLDSPRLAGTSPANALDAVVFAGGAADVHTVVVGGRVVVRDGHHRDLDVRGELADAISAVS